MGIISLCAKRGRNDTLSRLIYNQLFYGSVETYNVALFVMFVGRRFDRLPSGCMGGRDDYCMHEDGTLCGEAGYTFPVSSCCMKTYCNNAFHLGNK